MALTHAEVIDLGNAAEVILCNPMFNQIVDEFEKTSSELMVATKPDQAAERERIYARLVGTREFFAFMQAFVSERDHITSADQPQADDYDNPSVHEIYKED